MMIRFQRARCGRELTGLVAASVTVLLVWGCASQGDPFGRDLKPIVSITGVSPPDGALDVSPDTVISIAFPLELDPRTVSPDTVHVLDFSRADLLPSDQRNKNPRVVGARVLYDRAQRMITIVPDGPLAESSRYQVVLQDVRSASDVRFNTAVTTFTTGRSTRVFPQVLSIRPLPGQVLVLATSPVEITFSRMMDQASVVGALSVGPGVAGTAAFFDTDRTTMTFTPGSPFPAGQLIFVTVRKDAKDSTGLSMERAFTSLFTVEPPPYVIPEYTRPFDNAASVPRTTAVTLVFSTTMTTQTVADAFHLVYGSTVLGRTDGQFTFDTITWSGDPSWIHPPRTRARFAPTNQLPATTPIQIRVNSLARSTRGVALSPLFYSTFQTGP